MASNDEVPIYDFGGRSERDARDDGHHRGNATRLGTDPGVLEAEVADYNARIASGETDRLGRVHPRGQESANVWPIDSLHFFAQLSGTVVLATYCGVTVDTSMRVLDVYGDPIKRLYAAASSSAGSTAPTT